MRIVGLIITVICCCPIASAKLSLAHVFTDHAIIQADRPIKVWGQAKAGEKVAVQLGKTTRTTRADDTGRWVATFPAIKASYQPFQLSVRSSGKTLTHKNLLAGEVWLATGQSNMQWQLNQSTGGKEEIQSCTDPHLRLLNHRGTLHPGGKKYPRDFLTKLSFENYYHRQGWDTCTPESAARFSAVAYYFAKMLRKKLDVPVGVITLAVGGSPIEAHLPARAFKNHPKLSPLLHRWWENQAYPKWCRERAALNLTHWLADPEPGKDPPHPFAPTFLWRAGIEPLQQFPIRGVLWYQGESNATLDGGMGKPTPTAINHLKLRSLIDSFRQHWQDGLLPFYHVQLPGMNRNWVNFREMQQNVTDSTKAVGLAISIDVGHPTNVHPPNKKPVGERLARLALNQTYQLDIACVGPRLHRLQVDKDKITLSFHHADRLTTTDNRAPQSFEISGEDGRFFPATAIIKGNQIVLKCKQVKEPRELRYAWTNDPDVNLTNGAGLPAHPFHTIIVK